MSHSSLLILLALGWGAAFAQDSADLAVEYKQEAGQTKLVLRNVYHMPTQAYAIDFKDDRLPWRSECSFLSDVLLTKGARRLEPNGTIEVPLPPGPSAIRIAVVYEDGSMAGNPEILQRMLHTRAVVRSSIPFAELALQGLAARATTLPELVKDVVNWRHDLRDGGFSTLAQSEVGKPRLQHRGGVHTDETDYSARIMLHQRILDLFRASSPNGLAEPSLSEAIDRVIQMLQETEAALSTSPIEI